MGGCGWGAVDIPAAPDYPEDVSEMLRAKGVVVRAPGERAEVEEIEIDAPGAGEVRVHMLATGVCHTDLHAKLGDFGRVFPYLLGHESTAVVESVGPGVTSPRVGQTVMLSWRAHCGVCRFCVAGHIEHCARPLVAGKRMRTLDGHPLRRVLGLGTLATHCVVAASQAIAIETTLAPAASCLVGCAVATGVGAVLHAAHVRPGASVAVLGCGAVGLSVVQGARLVRASRIIAVDRVAAKLEFAAALGATDLVDASKLEPVARIRELTEGRGVEYAFEAVGLPLTLAQAVDACDLSGTAVLIGVPPSGAEVTLSMTSFFYGRRTLRATSYGDCIPARDFPFIVRLAERGELEIGRLVSQRIGLGDVEEAFEAMRQGSVVRSVVVFDG